ncbi:MAG TPA: hypothetical protein VGM02_00205 [Acidobacteriaceae bacterium]|jgi:hypothetical protein
MSKAESGLRGEAWRALVLIYASIQFVVLTAIAMLVYPGGAVYELDADRYLFFRNFFSDLGATLTPSGRPNLASHILLVIALGTIGIALILASSNWKVIVAQRQVARAAGFASQAFEIIAGVGFIGIAATPWNLVLDAHNGFVRAAFGFLLAYDLCLLLIQLRNRWPAAYTGTNAVYLLLLLAYVGILFFGPRLDTQAGLEFQVAAQKIIVYASVVNLGLQPVSIHRKAGYLSRQRDGSVIA